MFETLQIKQQFWRELQQRDGAVPPLPLHLEQLLQSEVTAHYDGNQAVTHEAWLHSESRVTDQDLIALYQKQPRRYTLIDVARGRQVVAQLAQQGFDLNCVVGESLGVDSSKWDSSRRQLVLRAILEQDWRVLAKVNLPAERIKRARALSAAQKQERAELQQATTERVKKLESAPVYEGEPMTDAEILVIATHQQEAFTQQVIPKAVSAASLEVAYQPQKGVVELVGADGRPLKISDRDGSIPLELMAKFLQPDGCLSIILTGGNLRGCLSQTLSSIMEAVEKLRVARVDVHYPLEAVYDNASYDEQRVNRFPSQHVIMRQQFGGSQACTYQTYLDGTLIDASLEQRQPVLRLYLWQSAAQMRSQWLDQIPPQS